MDDPEVTPVRTADGRHRVRPLRAANDRRGPARWRPAWLSGQATAAVVLTAVAVVFLTAGVSVVARPPAVTAQDVGMVPEAGPPAAGPSAAGSPAAAPSAAGSPAAGTPGGGTTAPTTTTAPGRPPAPTALAPTRLAPPPPAPPVRFALGSGATAPVVPVGVQSNGGLEVPENPGQVGWWVGSAPAGATAGSTVLAGHVDSADYGPGTFAALRTVAVGTRVTLTDTFGGKHDYRVAARRTFGKYDLPRDVFTVPGAPRLVLLTCGGPFDEDAGRYRDNIVVYALPA
jgi:hypothetical protein